MSMTLTKNLEPLAPIIGLAHELIGGVHPAGGWRMHAFDEADSPGSMRLTQEDSELLLLHGEGVPQLVPYSGGRGSHGRALVT